MKRKYVLFNNEKLNIPNWLKWIILIVSYFLCSYAISIVENIISKLSNVNAANVIQITFFIRVFIILSLIHDLAPRFKKIISILYSSLSFFVYVNIDSKAGDKLFLATLLFILYLIIFNIYLYKKPSYSKSK